MSKPDRMYEGELQVGGGLGKSYLDGPLTGQYTIERAAAMKRVAQEFGFRFERVAGEGTVVPTIDGGSTIVSEGHQYIKLYAGRKNLGEFWKKVDQIVPLEPDKTTKN